MRKPDFFIVGAPKCGTTAMDYYLKQHPEIFIPRKEIHFFGSDLQFTEPRITEERYLSLFACAQDKKRIGEASVWYLSSRLAAAEIKDFSPSASVIIMLRNPVDMMHSLHSHRVHYGNENILDFEEALLAEDDRKKGFRLPKNASNLMGFFYREAAKYSQQVKRYLNVFGRENVHIIIYDDLASDPPHVYKQTCEFLRVNSQYRPEFKIFNSNKYVRSRPLWNLLRRTSLSGWGIYLFAKTIPLGLNVRRRLARLNTRYGPRAPMNPKLRRRLQLEFLPEVEKLSRLLDRDLTHWCRT